MNFLDNYNIVLASQSPRRKELLEQLGFQFSIKSLDIDESYPAHLQKAEITNYLATQKSYAFGDLLQNEIIITADTIVWYNNTCLEKPLDKHDAVRILQLLSGNSHYVYSSVGVRSQEKLIVKSDCTKVYFSTLSDEEILYYVDNYKPFDKAGSYGIQDFIGLAKINKIKGSYFTVMGLPTHLVYDIMQKIVH